MIEFTAIAVWLAGTSGSIAVGRVTDVIKHSFNRAKFKRKLINGYKNAIEDVKTDEDFNHDIETIVELNRLEANIHSFKPVIDDISKLNELPHDKRREKTEKILVQQLKEDYDIPEEIVEELVADFLEISYKVFRQFSEKSDDQFRAEVLSSLERIEEQNIEQVELEFLFWNSISDINKILEGVKLLNEKVDILLSREEDQQILKNYICTLENQVTHLKSNIESERDYCHKLWLKVYLAIFNEIKHNKESGNIKDAIKKSEELIFRINQDRKINKNEIFWKDISIKVMEYECFTYFNLANFYYKLKNHKKSLEAINKSIHTSENTDIGNKFLSGNYNNRAIILAELGKNEMAEHDYEMATKTNPSSAEAYNNYAKLLADLDRKEEAEQNYIKALQTNPILFQAYNNYANLLKKTGKYKEAEQNYKKAIEINPNYAEAYNNYANLLKKSNRKEEAEQNYKKAIENNPNYAEAYNNYAILLDDSERKKEAKENFSKAIEINPNYAEAYNNYAKLLAGLDRKEEAEQNYKKAVKINPNFFEALNNYAILLDNLGKKNEAEQYYKKAIKIKPNSAEIFYNYAIHLQELNKKREAEQYYKKTIEINPKHFGAHNNYANLLDDLGKTKEAEQYYKKAIEINPKYADTYFNYAIFLNDLGRKKEAEQYYSKAIEIDPELAIYLNPLL